MLGFVVEQLPAHCASRYVVRARFIDTDLMGIVHHATYLSWFEAGRVEYLHRRGLESLAWRERSLHLPVIEAHVRYRKSVQFDETLIVETRLTELTRIKMKFEYQIMRRADEELVAEGYTILVSVNTQHVPQRLPLETLELLRAPETHPRPIDQV